MEDFLLGLSILLLAAGAVVLTISHLQQGHGCSWQPWRWRRRAVAAKPRKKTRVSGCGTEVLDARGTSLGRFLCYDLSCLRCREAAQERQRRLLAARLRTSSSGQKPQATPRPSQPGCRRRLGRRGHRKLLPRRGQQSHQALGPLAAHPSFHPDSQPDELVGPTSSVAGPDVGHRASSAAAENRPTTTDGDGGHQVRITDPHPVSRLQLGKDFTKRLQVHVQRKGRQIHLGTFSSLVRWSYQSSAHETVPLVPRQPISTYFWVPEASFLPEETREALELHLRDKKLHRDVGSPYVV